MDVKKQRGRSILYLVFNLVGAGFAVGGGIMHSRLTAAETRHRALCHFRRLSGMLLLIVLTIAALGNVFMPQLLTGLGAGTDVPLLRDLCRSYVQPLITATPLFFLNFLLYFCGYEDFLIVIKGLRLPVWFYFI